MPAAAVRASRAQKAVGIRAGENRSGGAGKCRGCGRNQSGKYQGPLICCKCGSKLGLKLSLGSGLYFFQQFYILSRVGR